MTTDEEAAANHENMERGKEDAASILADEIFDAIMLAKKMSLLSDDMLDDYFRKYDFEKGNDERLSIAWEYRRYSLYAELLDDCIMQFSGLAKKLEAMRERGYDRKRAAKIA